MKTSQLLLVSIALWGATTAAKAVVGPQFHEQPDDPPLASAPAKANSSTSHAKPGAASSSPTAAPKATMPTKTDGPKTESVDSIKGVGPYKFGAKVTDYSVTALQIVDPKAKGVLLRVCPYGDNYLVTNVKGMTWGGVPVKGMVLTFQKGELIDFQIALKAKKGDLYVANQAFRDKYGPSDPTTFPVQTWTGSHIQVTLVFPGAEVFDARAIDAPGQGKVELFDWVKWKKYEAEKTAELKKLLEQRYEATSQKAKDNL